MTAAARGVLLVEFLGDGRYADSKAQAWPFLAGYLTAQGVPWRWLCFSREAQRAASDPLIVELRPEARARLLAEAAEIGATHALLSELPDAGLDAFLRPHFADARHLAVEWQDAVFRRRWVADWLGLPDREDGLLPDAAPPRYECRAGDGVIESARPLTHLVGGPICLFAAPLRRNPHYRGVDLAGINRPFGCAFCHGPLTLRHPFRTPSLDLALGQIRAVQSCPGTLRDPREFLVDDARVFFDLAGFFDRLEAAAIPPGAFYFRCRPDEVLAEGEAIERVLPRARRAGHRLHVVSMGVENFSEVENERLNRRISLAQVREALARLRDWEERFPEAFFFDRDGGLGFILWTPWTTLADLRKNLAAARELDLGHARFFLTRRMMLLEDRPITRLAARDGLLELGEADARLFHWLARFCDPGCRNAAHQRDVPWRFRDPAAAAVCALAVRVAKPDAIVPGDPWHTHVVEALRDSALRDDPLGAFALLLDAAEALGGAPDVEALLGAFLARLPAAAPPPADATPPPWAKAYFRLFAAAGGASGEALRGFALRDVSAREGRVRLAFSRAGEEFVLWAAPADAGAPAFVRAGGLGLCYDESTPPTDEDRRQLIVAAARLLARSRARRGYSPK